MRHYINGDSRKREKKPINKGLLRREVRLVRALDAPPVDPFQQHRELRGAQAHCPMRRLRPHEAPAFKTLGEEAQSIPAPSQDLYPIARSATKHEQLPREWILGELRLHESSESIEALAHVGHARCEPYLHSRRQCNHRCTRRSITRERASVSTRPCSTMLWPLLSLISMSREACLGSEELWLGTGRGARSVGSTVGVLTFTGSIFASHFAAGGCSNPRRYSCLQANTWLGLTL